MKNNNNGEHSTDIDAYKYSKKVAAEIISAMNVQHDGESDNLKEWYVNNSSASKVINTIVDENSLEHEVADFGQSDLRQQSLERLKKNMAKNLLRRRLINFTSIAAAMMAITLLVHIYGVDTESQKHIVAAEITEKLEKKITEPTLILPGGYSIKLNNATSLIGESVKVKRSELDYFVCELEATSTNLSQVKAVEYHTMIIPSKYTYTISLPDGTKVTLNAGSKLTYPTYFNGDSRQVDLVGEGYFEVTKSTKPFIVRCEGAAITVYGTKFNVNGYVEEQVKTTLFEGSVGVKSLMQQDAKEYMLRPNEKMSLETQNGTYLIEPFDSIRYKSWSDGYFYADGDSLEQMLRVIGEWYDIHFTFGERSKKSISLVGVFHQDFALDKILKSIEEVADVEFVKDERGYIVR